MTGSMISHLDGAIADGLHRMQVRIYYEDTDLSDLTMPALLVSRDRPALCAIEF